jgi:hypothetical protein
MTIPKTLFLGAALAVSLAGAAQAQDDQSSAKAYPPCSATVTDNCMQHEGGGHRAMGHRAGRGHHARGHRARHPTHHSAAHKRKT